MTRSSGALVDTDAMSALEIDLRSRLGDGAVTTDLPGRERASADGSHLSPIISAQLPLGLADIVAFPTSAEEIAFTVAAACRAGVPVTPRGKGTGNYGQAIPMRGGLVLDTSRARSIIEVGEDTITADAGASMVALEQAAARVDRQILMYPSTAHSTIGGFLAGGSGGTGSIKHGTNSDGFVVALDVVHAAPVPGLVHVTGDDAQAHLHNYGTAGIIARATVRTEPRQEWRAVLASFDDFPRALSSVMPLAELEPAPRLVSADPPLLAEALPADSAIPGGRASLRAIVDARALGGAVELIERAGGRVEDVREGAAAVMKLSMISYNHPIEWLQRAHPGVYFHVEVSGKALVERLGEVLAVYPGGVLHVEAQRDRPIGMLAGFFTSPEAVYAGFQGLRDLGVGYHNPHQWFVDFHPDRTRDLARTTDPRGLLNPGKLVDDPGIDTGLKGGKAGTGRIAATGGRS